MIQEFNKYVNQFDISDKRIMNKIEHSLRVASKMKEYAEKLNFTEDEIQIAYEIGLLHDIGRFKQIEKTNSFMDTNEFDHADYAINLLFKENYIEKFQIDKNHYETIKHAIYNHNKYRLQQHDDPKILNLSRLIRDIDKIDILYIFGTLNVYDEKSDDSEINIEILNSIRNYELINWEKVKTNNDKIAQRFALAFDMNFTVTLKEIKENLIKYYNKIENENRFNDIFKTIKNYLNERIDKAW